MYIYKTFAYKPINVCEQGHNIKCTYVGPSKKNKFECHWPRRTYPTLLNVNAKIVSKGSSSVTSTANLV